MQRSLESPVNPNTFSTACADASGVLREIFELLQDYAPIWYTEELHNRTAAALGELVLEPAIH